MKLAIMQPYFFPYIGYWQLMVSVDKFIIFDDVNFITRGYINRNSILIFDKKQRITLDLIESSQNKCINQITVGSNGQKILKTIAMAYRKSPFFYNVYPLINSILNYPEKNLAKFLGNLLQKISDYLEIETTIIYSSGIDKDNSLKSQDKIINICKLQNATQYINAIGGVEIYDKKAFDKSGITLSFLNPEIIEYKQFKNDFVPYLSIIDILMFNEIEVIKIMLKKYELV